MSRFGQGARPCSFGVAGRGPEGSGGRGSGVRRGGVGEVGVACCSLGRNASHNIICMYTHMYVNILYGPRSERSRPPMRRPAGEGGWGGGRGGRSWRGGQGEGMVPAPRAGDARGRDLPAPRARLGGPSDRPGPEETDSRPGRRGRDPQGTWLQCVRAPGDRSPRVSLACVSGALPFSASLFPLSISLFLLHYFSGFDSLSPALFRPFASAPLFLRAKAGSERGGGGGREREIDR